jgi:hypothetical protein
MAIITSKVSTFLLTTHKPLRRLLGGTSPASYLNLGEIGKWIMALIIRILEGVVSMNVDCGRKRACYQQPSSADQSTSTFPIIKF